MSHNIEGPKCAWTWALRAPQRQRAACVWLRGRAQYAVSSLLLPGLGPHLAEISSSNASCGLTSMSRLAQLQSQQGLQRFTRCFFDAFSYRASDVIVFGQDHIELFDGRHPAVAVRSFNVAHNSGHAQTGLSDLSAVLSNAFTMWE